MKSIFQRTLSVMPDVNFTVFGGALRDTFLGRPVRDIDIAINQGSMVPRGAVQISNHDFGSYEDAKIDSVYELGELNIILFADNIGPEVMNKYVDIGLCAVAWSPLQGLHQSTRFYTDMFKKTLTVQDRGFGREGSIAHARRLLQKYPEYTIVFPDDWNQDQDTTPATAI